MNNPLDLFAWKLRSERKRQHLTQKALAERLHMSVRTIIEIEKCKSNPKFETVALLAKELNISLDAAIFPDMVTGTVSKTVVDFFAGKSEAEIQKYIALCKQAETFQKDVLPPSSCGQINLLYVSCRHPVDARRTSG